MVDYVTLLGSEQVSNAGHNIGRAADEMKSAAATIETAMFNLNQSMHESVNCFENAVNRLIDALEKSNGRTTKETT
jgi:hypothetical protein